MNIKTYFTLIKYKQELLLGISILLMMFLPILIVFRPDLINSQTTTLLYLLAHLSLFFVMSIRPLADIFTKTIWIRPLVILRKGAGVFSASIVVSFILAKLIVDPSTYFASILTLKYWSLVNFAVLAHLADISAVILILTSNDFSKRILGASWKSLQQLSYVYFYCSVLYVYLSYRSTYLIVALVIITALVFIAFLKNKKRDALIKTSQNQTIQNPVVNLSNN